MMRKAFITAGLLLASASATWAADPVGVPACDDFLTKYDACITAKVPAEQQAQVKASIDMMRSQWKAAAATPQGKTAIEASCTQTAATMKQQSAALGCTW